MSDRFVPEEQAGILDRRLKENNVFHELYYIRKVDQVFGEASDSLSTQLAYEKVKLFFQKYKQ